jgi:hypothetical protein
MKKLIFLLTIIFVTAKQNCVAQNLACGVVEAATVSPNSTVACSGLVNGQFSLSNSFLDDLIPKSADQTLTVNICIWVFTPTSGAGSWSGANQNDADFLMFHLNTSLFNNSVPPGTQVPDVSQTPIDPKIVFAWKSFSVIPNSALCYSINGVPQQYYDANAINVYYGSTPTPSIGYLQYVLSIPSKSIFYNTNNATANIGNTGSVMAHELGHALGLKHVRAVPEGYSSIVVPESCCGNIFATDYELLTPHAFSTTAAPCGSLNVTNNVMSYN